MNEPNRREFAGWTAALWSSLAAGVSTTLSGCEQGAKKADITDKEAGASKTPKHDPEELIATEPHVCRGLNTCKELGKSKENRCAGQGTCANIVAHSCGTMNDCAGQGGCGGTPGMNDCKGQGHCSVPLMEFVWPKARTAFEAAMKTRGKEVGPAPAAPKEE